MDFELFENELMSGYTTFKTGGKASRLYKVYTIDGLISILNSLKEENVKPLIVGNGSNLLVSDKGIDAPVIVIGQGLDNISVEGSKIKAGAGAMLSAVSKVALANSLAGMEFASGIPGTVGGAIYMNAGAYGGEMKDIVESVEAVIDGEIKTISGTDMDFDYRHSRAMMEDMVIISMTVNLESGKSEEISAKMNDFNGRRRDKQPLEYPSAGSTFKRPTGYFAGKLIMDSGLAGYRVGGAMVSPKHCGFVINYDHATSTDIYRLIQDVQRIVKDKYGVTLETEVKLIGDFE